MKVLLWCLAVLIIATTCAADARSRWEKVARERAADMWEAGVIDEGQVQAVEEALTSAMDYAADVVHWEYRNGEYGR